MKEEIKPAFAQAAKQEKPQPQSLSVLDDLGIAYRIVKPGEDDTPRSTCGLGWQCCQTDDGLNYN